MSDLHTVASQTPDYDPDALPLPAARDFLLRLAQPVGGVEDVPVLHALDRVLAEDLVSPVDVPPHDNAAMDGYAFDGAQLGPQPPPLRIVGTVLAGTPWPASVPSGCCVRIMTGAVMPAGTDTVVPQELVQVQDGAVQLAAGSVRAGDHRRLCGEDLRRGHPALLKGERLTPAALGLAASLGVETLRCWRRLRVAYCSTGDEILSLGDAPRAGAVYDSNRYTVTALLRHLGCEVLDLGVVPDDPSALAATLRQAAAQADVVLSSGGVSVGEADHTKAVLQGLGQMAFWKVAMRPGRPLAVGLIPKENLPANADATSAGSYQTSSKRDTAAALLIGLPGNPVAVMVSFLALVRPTLLRCMGCSTMDPPLVAARSRQAIRKKAGRTEYPRGTVQRDADGTLWVDVAPNQGSGVLSSMARADALIVLDHARGDVAAGESVPLLMLSGIS